MKKQSSQAARVETLLDDLRSSNSDRFKLFAAARQSVLDHAPDIREKVMYGGLIFTAVEDFCGVFAYKAHVSVEFSFGTELSDDAGVLEGKGKYRRHLKLRTPADIGAKDLAGFVEQAYQMARV